VQEGNLARNLSGGKETWFTEICCYGAASAADRENPAAALTYSQGYEPTMVGALQLGSLLYQSFTQTGDVHFDWWTALSNGLGCAPLGNATCVTAANSNGWNDGLIYYDPSATTNSNFAIYQVKRFHLLRHFAHFVPIGSTRFGVSELPANVLGLAFKDAKGGGASLLLMNMGAAVSSASVSSVGLGAVQSAWQTSPAADWVQLGNIGQSVSLPALSITTFLFN